MAESRKNVLGHVRDQAKLLLSDFLKTTKGPNRPWSQEQWYAAFTFLLLQDDTSSSQQPDPSQVHHDDMLFFTWKVEVAVQQQETVFVRRKPLGMPPELQPSGKDFALVDWGRSLLLNLVLQSRYQLTVVACGPAALPFVAEDRTWAQDIKTVTKQVYASPTKTAVNLDDSKGDAVQPEPCYPNICFAVDNFHDAFEDLVLNQEGDCYCVVLHALLDDEISTPAADALPGPELDMPPAKFGSHSNPHSHHTSSHSLGIASSHTPSSAPARAGEDAWQAVDLGPAPSSAAASPKAVPGDALSRRLQQQLQLSNAQHSRNSSRGSSDWQIGTRKKTLFSGYVSYEQIATYISGSKQQSLLDKLRGIPVQQRARDKVIMSGPEGIGRAEVAVTKLAASDPLPEPAIASSNNSSRATSRSSSMASRLSPGGGSSGSYRDSISSPQLQAAGEVQQGWSNGGGAATLLGRARAAAKQVASNIGKVVAEVQQAQSGEADQQQRMQCALMHLTLPVDKLIEVVLEVNSSRVR